jgi:hypothetical protein
MEWVTTYFVDLEIPYNGTRNLIDEFTKPVMLSSQTIYLAITCTQVYLSEISGSHGGEYEDDCLLGC